MSTAPQIPPRPVRAQQPIAQPADNVPQIPPRPISKRIDRSVSPSNYPRSPLNEPFDRRRSSSRPSSQLGPDGIHRKPSLQQIPGVGQEGSEYAELHYQPLESISNLPSDGAEHTRQVADDLHLHAPKPSLSKASATAQVQAVTKTDLPAGSAQSMSSPGMPAQPDESVGRVRSRASFSRPDSTTAGERRISAVYGEDQGPAEVGIRVPINPLLGDVQAPSPAQFSPHNTGQNGEKKRPHHYRTTSGRGTLPPDSYGLHGHGVGPHDQFEKDWYAKHPEQLQYEESYGHGVYESIGSGRGAFAMSSDDLNKIVRDTASRGAGFGTSGNTMSYPDEQIGYMASEHYTSRSQTNTPAQPLSKTATNVSQPAYESPLRKASTPAEGEEPAIKTQRSGSKGDNEDTTHVDAPKGHYNKVTGGEESMNETEDLRPYVTHKNDDDQDYRVPILASDEVAKGGAEEYLHPAISPKYERRGSNYEVDHHRSGEATPTSRPSSRPGSIYGMHSASHSLSRFVSHHDERESMHTPLEDVDEYEPLFPEDDKAKKTLSHAERFKQRPDALRHRFPSQDIWEDTPSSAMYEAEVSTPEPQPETQTSTLFEHPDVDAARKGEASEAEKAKLIPKEERLAKSKFAPHLRDDMPTRPGMQPRFPSQDIWEDSPDSHHLVATVNAEPDEDEITSPVDNQAKPGIPPRPAAKLKGNESEPAASGAPAIPARPPKRLHAVPPFGAELTKITSPTSELRKAPSIPDRPKPQIPARPAKKVSAESLSKTMSNTSDDISAGEKALGTSPPNARAKPAIPARPVQSDRFGGVKGNFMEDLNKKLGLGPPKPKEPEPEPEEAKPLEDARKSRARGPQRRAPVKASAAPTTSNFSFAIAMPRALWQIDEEGSLNIPDESKKAKTLSSEEAPLTEAAQEENITEVPETTTLDAQEELDTDAQLKESVKPLEPMQAVAGGSAQPTLGSPTAEKSNPMSHNSTFENLPVAKVADSVVHEDRDKDGIQDVADDDENFQSRSTEKKAPEEPIQLRNEQMSAPAPSSNEDNAQPAPANGQKSRQLTDEQLEDIKVGADAPKEPMPEDDVSYKKLEHDTAVADGKTDSEDSGIRKIMD